MAAEDSRGRPLQLVQLNMKEKKVEVNEEAWGTLEKRLAACPARKVAVVSVMGAFRTGKSFLLDLFLRHLRYERKAEERQSSAETPPRGGDEKFPLPAWITDAGNSIEGGSGDTDGFRFKGGMDHCTEGIWVWSEPFLRKIDGEDVALLLMDTQGAWDGNMTKEQSATIFGLTALISSKQIYNINMQIQEDKVENLAYFMRFAQAALRKASDGGHSRAVEKPFQSLDFLVRDWANFEDEWTMDQCREQMAQHLDRHLNPKNVVEGSTAEALQSMFSHIGCFCLPHPGLKIQKAAWTGTVTDIDRDFVRFADTYVHEVFSQGLAVKTVLGSELTTTSFPEVLRKFVTAFQDAAPAAMSFTQAMQSATILLAKEQVIKSYNKRMDEVVAKNHRGMEAEAFKAVHTSVSKAVEEEYKSVTILGSDDTRVDAWKTIEEQLKSRFQTYCDDNARKLEKVLVAFANIALVALTLFILDRASDWTCDWWSQTCRHFSMLAFWTYFGIIAFVGLHVYFLFAERGGLSTAAAATELWKEMMKLASKYVEQAQQLKRADLEKFASRAAELAKEYYEKALQLQREDLEDFGKQALICAHEYYVKAANLARTRISDGKSGAKAAGKSESKKDK